MPVRSPLNSYLKRRKNTSAFNWRSPAAQQTATKTKYDLKLTPSIQSSLAINQPASSTEAAKIKSRQQAYRSKASDILGDNADSILGDSARAEQYLQQALARRRELDAQAQAQPQWGGVQTQGEVNVTGGNLSDIDRYLAGLRAVESSNNYRARSPISSASGAYQYINSTWNNYGGYSAAYLAPQSVQDARARADAQALFNRYGNWEQVAAHHFYPAYASDRSKWNIAPGRGNPTVNTYVRKVMSAMGQTGSGVPRPVGGDVSNIRQRIVNTAMGYRGIPYVWGGKTPRGFDCSGLTSYVYRQFGINLPAWSNHQTQFGTRSHISNARPGDLVGWNKGGHVAIYIGGGKILHSPRPGQTVQVRSLFSGEGVYAVRLTLPGD